MNNNFFIILKPDVIADGLVGKIISIIEEKNLVITDIYSYCVSSEFIKEFYKVHINKDFFKDLHDYLFDTKIIVVFLKFKNEDSNIDVLKFLNRLKGDCYFPEPGTIRFRFSKSIMKNVIHVSDKIENYSYELKIIQKYIIKSSN